MSCLKKRMIDKTVHVPIIPRPIVIPKYPEVGLDIIKSCLRTADMSQEQYLKLLSEV